MIKNTDWSTMADYIYDGPNRKVPYISKMGEPCIVYVPMDNIAEFFLNIQNIKKDYIVISANSDYGVHYQQAAPVWKDMKKWLSFVQLDENAAYHDLHLPRRCRAEYCKITDDYSVKVYSYTKATFSQIPSNIIKWFGTNLNIGLANEKIERIPFGIPEWTYNLLEPSLNKENKIYCNFQLNTNERLQLSQIAKQHPECVWSDEVDKETYVSHLQKYKYILCPEGNGLDSFRVSETLYCWSIPVLFKNQWTDLYKDYAIIVDNLQQLNLEYLEANQPLAKASFGHSLGNLDYWKDKINEIL